MFFLLFKEIYIFLRIKYFKKPEWLKSKDEMEANEAEVKYVFEIIELYKIDGNTEEFFKAQYK